MIELILMMILAPLAAGLIQMWISRTREYEADHTGALLTHNPPALASALQKLDDYSKRIPLDVKKGDRILIGKYAGTEIKLEDEELLILREDEVLAIVETK